jgi:mRNA capping enzyme
MVCFAWLICDFAPLRLSSIPAEIIARNARTLKSQIIPSSKMKTSIVYHGLDEGDYPQCVDTCDMSGIVTIMDWAIKRSPPVIKAKTGLDQTYRLHGSVSTTFYKVMEIISKENIEISGAAITLAEGEGSIARLLFKLGADTIYYDTLVNKASLIPQRGVHIVPAYMAEYCDHVKWCEQMTITGGDLCDIRTLSALLNECLTGVSITTCDAESSKSITPLSTMRIVYSWLALAIKSNARVGLFKTFCESDEHMVHVLGMIYTVFDKVKIITPHFSSNEGYEVYMLAQENNCKITIPQILLSLYTTWRTLGLRGIVAPKFSDTRLTDGSKDVSHTRGRFLPPGRFLVLTSGTSCVDHWGHSAAGKIRQIKNSTTSKNVLMMYLFSEA